MRPVIKLSQAWLDELGWTPADAAPVLDIDLAGAVPAGWGDVCPQCSRHHAEYRGSMFVPDPETVTSEQEHGRTYIYCLCGATYWYVAVDVLNEPSSDARVRAASVTVTPGTGALQIDGQPVPPLVIEEITATDVGQVALGGNRTGNKPPMGAWFAPGHFHSRWFAKGWFRGL